MAWKNTAWWADRVAYQIYPRSFADGDGDGVGDLPGIISRLDHLAWLGVGVLWLSPVYRSPMADMGYDIADYRDIDPLFGTMEDFDRLLAEAKRRDIAVIMDLVVNHSSDAHPWFQAARAARDAPTRDFYVWRDPGQGGGPPDDRRSYFGGPAWTFVEETGQYYLHLFTPEQPDLNWRNPTLRAKIHDMMRWWLDRGIAGFRMDVIDLIGKDVETGEIEEGPHLHAYLQEMQREALAGRDALTVGETWNATTETALLYCGRDRGELSMVFQFEHIVQDLDPFHGKWQKRPFSLPRFRGAWDRWQAALADDGWNSLYLSNHDLPRPVSTYGDDGAQRSAAAKMLLTVMHLMKGTPYIYQGEEIGMTNMPFTSPDELRDVESLNRYAERVADGADPQDVMAEIRAVGRDNARTPVQWDAGPGAGFTQGEPWIGINPNHLEINVAAQRDDPDSVLHHARRLIALRREHPVIVHGRYVPYLPDDERVWCYTRELDGTRLAVVASFAPEPVPLDLPEGMQLTGRCLIANAAPRDRLGARVELAPYEAVAVLAGR